jgi:nucleotide-binding universal stress UspA family protein
MKKILVPCDFTVPAQQAYKFAVDIAEVSKGVVHVLKVIDIPFMYETTFGVQPYWHNASLFPELVEEAKLSFGKLQALFPRSGVQSRFSVERGPVASTILEAIKEHEIDLVVMGTRGSNGVKGFFIGSNTEKIVRSSTVPVLGVREAPEPGGIRSIVFPTLLDLNETHLVLKIKELQDFFQARLHVLRVNTPARFIRDRDAQTALKQFAELYKLENYTLNIMSDTYEQDGIVRFARDIKADMIAMATHGRKGLSHLITGSIAEDVLNDVTVPIWTYVVKNGS